jgi:hypothetical protein
VEINPRRPGENSWRRAFFVSPRQISFALPALLGRL